MLKHLKYHRPDHPLEFMDVDNRIQIGTVFHIAIDINSYQENIIYSVKLENEKNSNDRRRNFQTIKIYTQCIK